MATRQKKIALVNDVTGFGKCSVTVQLPLISAMGVQACPLPTAILSVHTGFPNHYMDDYTAHMRPYMDSWAVNGLMFDAILTGFLGSAGQIEVVRECIVRFKNEQTLVLVDPVMGDHGALYSSYTPALCERMKELLPLADVVTPNLTEACILLGKPYPAGGEINDEDLLIMASAIADRGPRAVVITGLHAGRQIKTYLYENGTGKAIFNDRVGIDRSGSGDAFAAIVAAGLVRGESLEVGVTLAVDFVGKCIVKAEEMELPWNYGLPFEAVMGELIKQVASPYIK